MGTYSYFCTLLATVYQYSVYWDHPKKKIRQIVKKNWHNKFEPIWCIQYKDFLCQMIFEKMYFWQLQFETSTNLWTFFNFFLMEVNNYIQVLFWIFLVWANSIEWFWRYRILSWQLLENFGGISSCRQTTHMHPYTYIYICMASRCRYVLPHIDPNSLANGIDISQLSYVYADENGAVSQVLRL